MSEGLKVGDPRRAAQDEAQRAATELSYEPGSMVLHDKKVEVVNVPTPDGFRDSEILVKVDGELLPLQRRVIVDSGMEETSIEIELLHLPTGGDIHISGYLIDEADWQFLCRAKQKGIRV